MPRLENKVALVTGSSRGVGAAIARLFAQEGAHVALHGRDAAALAATRTQIEDAHGHAIAITAELTRLPEIDAMCRQVTEALGPIDILVANAGNNYTWPGALVARAGPVEEMNEDVWRALLDNNLTATFLTLKSVVPEMKKRRSGTIITMSSVAGRRPHARAPIGYAVAKAGIELLTQNLAMQCGPYNIRANCIAPATILTDRNRDRMTPEQQEELTRTYALGRLGLEDDVARAALYLASDESSWVTGVVLDVAGGLPIPR